MTLGVTDCECAGLGNMLSFVAGMSTLMTSVVEFESLSRANFSSQLLWCLTDLAKMVPCSCGGWGTIFDWSW